MATKVTSVLLRGAKLSTRPGYSRVIASRSDKFNHVAKVQFSNAPINESGAEYDGIEEEMELKRNISRLPKHLHQAMNHTQSPDMGRVPGAFEERLFKRKLFAKYGKASEVDPSILWPSAQELEDMKEDEDIFHKSLEEMRAAMVQKNEEILQKRLAKEADVAKQMAKMPELIEKFRDKLRKLEDEEKKQSQKQKVLMEEARDYFGYDIDTKDPRFEKMKEEKEAEELLLKKKRKKEEKQAKFMAAIQSITAATKPGQSKDKKMTESSSEESKSH